LRPGGYIWSFPRPDHLAVGICAKADDAPAPDVLRDIVRLWIQKSEPLQDASVRAYSWPIPTLSAADLSQEIVSGSRWLLLGDAAGLVDSLTREGIYFALKSAELAAQSVLHEAQPSVVYRARVRDELCPELTRAAFFARGFFQPGFTRLLMRALTQSEAIRAVMRDLVCGAQPYRGLEWRLLSTLEIGLAARLASLKIAASRQRAT
jgi:flavin-dependent dehydrogenase